MATTLQSSTLERLIPDSVDSHGTTGAESLQLHLQRYEFAVRHLPPPSGHPMHVLDLSCGVGYGSSLLADRRPDVHVLGIDIDAHAIDYASQRYASDRVRFQTSDALQFLSPCAFHAIVSLETIEHLSSPAAFLKNVAGNLRPNGIFVASVPVTYSTDANPYHLHDFSPRSFRNLLTSAGFVEFDALSQIQRYRILPLLQKTERRSRDLRPHLLRYYLTHPHGALRRVASLLKHGPTNKYLTLALKINAPSQTGVSHAS